MHEMSYILFFIAGVAIGAIFFAALKWQVLLLVEKKTLLCFSLITLVRFGVLAVFVYLILRYGNWEGGMLMLAGIMTARFIAVHRSKKGAVNP